MSRAVTSTRRSASGSRSPSDLTGRAYWRTSGFGLTVIHLASIPIDGTSQNPARLLGVAWFAGGGALAQVWLFIIGPIVGAAIAGATYAIITGAGTADVGVAPNPELARRDQPA